MKIVFKKSFLKEINKIRDKSLKNSITETILEVENVKSINEIKNLKKLTGYREYYRIRIGDYRIGLKLEYEQIYFVIIEHRKDIYNRFP